MTSYFNNSGNRKKFNFQTRVNMSRENETSLRLISDIEKIKDMGLDISSEIVDAVDIERQYKSLPNYNILNLKLLVICHFLITNNPGDMSNYKNLITEHQNDIFKIFNVVSEEQKIKLKEDIFIYLTYITTIKDKNNEAYESEEEYSEEEYSEEELEEETEEETEERKSYLDNIENIARIWFQKFKGNKPNAYICVDRDDNVYYTTRDKGKIVFIIQPDETKNKKYIIYAIPKKYLDLNEYEGNKYWLIRKTSKLNLINCNGNTIDHYDRFVAQNILPYLN